MSISEHLGKPSMGLNKYKHSEKRNEEEEKKFQGLVNSIKESEENDTEIRTEATLGDSITENYNSDSISMKDGIFSLLPLVILGIVLLLIFRKNNHKKSQSIEDASQIRPKDILYYKISRTSKKTKFLMFYITLLRLCAIGWLAILSLTIVNVLSNLGDVPIHDYFNICIYALALFTVKELSTLSKRSYILNYIYLIVNLLNSVLLNSYETYYIYMIMFLINILVIFTPIYIYFRKRKELFYNIDVSDYKKIMDYINNPSENSNENISNTDMSCKLEEPLTNFHETEQSTHNTVQNETEYEHNNFCGKCGHKFLEPSNYCPNC